MVAVVFTDEALFELQKRSPLPRDVIASALRSLDAMNPKAIGIDILFDQPQDEEKRPLAGANPSKAAIDRKLTQDGTTHPPTP